MNMKNPAEYINQGKEIIGVNLSQYSATMGNSVQSLQNSVNTWTAEMREYWMNANGWRGPAGRVRALQMRLKNPDIGAAFDPPPTYTPPENSAERQRDQTTPAHQKNLVDRLNGEERRNSDGGKYSGKGYNESRYRGASYADPSRQPSGLVYLSKEAFMKLSNDVLKKIRSVYQRKEGNDANQNAGTYNPLRSGDAQSRVLQFPTGDMVQYNLPLQQAGTIEDKLEDAA